MYTIAAGLLCALVFGILKVSQLFYLMGPGYYAPKEAIESELRRLRGISHVEVIPHEGLIIDDVMANIEVKGKGRLVLLGVEKSDMLESRHVFVSAIGPYCVRMDGYEFEASGERRSHPSFSWSCVDFGNDGIVSPLLSFHVGGVQDAVDRYDSISAEVASWPRVPGGTFAVTNNGVAHSPFVVMLATNKTDGAAR